MTRPLLTLTALLLPLTAQAQDWTYTSSWGDDYSFETNANGAVLRSLYPKAWFIEGGAASRVERGIDVIYFGVSLRCPSRRVRGWRMVVGQRRLRGRFREFLHPLRPSGD